MTRILCIWLPNWPVQRLVAARPELKRQAVALYARDPRRGECIVACSPPAAARGIRPDMRVAEAAALGSESRKVEEFKSRRVEGSRSQRGEDSVNSSSFALQASVYLEPYIPEADRAALEQLAEWCERFSPTVGLEEAEQPQSLLMDVTGVGRVFGDESRLAQQIVKSFQQRGYVVLVAIADTVGAAWAAAHFISDCKSQISNRKSGDACVIPPGDSSMVNKLLVESLRLPDQTVTLLHQLGVRRIEQLAQLPRASLRSRFGDELVARLNQLTGAEPELIVPHRPAAPLEAHCSLEHPTAHRATIQHIVAQLVEQVAQRLRQRDLGAVTIECRLHPSGSEPIEIRIGLFEPTAEPQHLLDLLRMQLETLAVPGAVGRASVRVVDSAPLVRRQHDLLADTLRHHPQQLAALVDRLSTRLGRDRVVRPQLHADAQPELAYRHVPLTGPQARRRDDQPHETLGPFHRPLLMHYPPLPLEVVSIVPDGPPVLFHHRGGQQQVACCWGPERIETGWWRGQSVRRDYYRIETAAGQRFWMFRRLQDGQWFLHGEFE